MSSLALSLLFLLTLLASFFGLALGFFPLALAFFVSLAVRFFLTAPRFLSSLFGFFALATFCFLPLSLSFGSFSLFFLALAPGFFGFLGFLALAAGHFFALLLAFCGFFGALFGFFSLPAFGSFALASLHVLLLLFTVGSFSCFLLGLSSFASFSALLLESFFGLPPLHGLTLLPGRFRLEPSLALASFFFLFFLHASGLCGFFPGQFFAMKAGLLLLLFLLFGTLTGCGGHALASRKVGLSIPGVLGQLRLAGQFFGSGLCNLLVLFVLERNGGGRWFLRLCFLGTKLLRPT